MARKSVLQFLALVLGLGVLMGCGLVSPETSFAPTHPVNLGSGLALCSDCHSNDASKGALKLYATLDHTPAFVRDHRMQANQDSNTCAVCHAISFCADCHGGKVAMKPATKWADRPDLESPHRGDYLTLHKIEGRLDSSSCYRCHGRANNDQCRACHR
jgi:hypothetical protein